MGIAKKTDGRYVVGLGVTDANDYKGSAAYRDIYIQLTSSGATEQSEEYLTFLKDYAVNANALGEPIMPPSVNVWISNNGVTTAVEADDVAIDGANYTICGIKWDGSAWDYSNAGQGSGGGSGSGLPAYTSADIGKVLTVGEASPVETEVVVVPEQTVTVSQEEQYYYASLADVNIDWSNAKAGDSINLTVNGSKYTANYSANAFGVPDLPAFVAMNGSNPIAAVLNMGIDNVYDCEFLTTASGDYTVSATAVQSVIPSVTTVIVPEQTVLIESGNTTALLSNVMPLNSNDIPEAPTVVLSRIVSGQTFTVIPENVYVRNALVGDYYYNDAEHNVCVKIDTYHGTITTGMYNENTSSFQPTTMPGEFAVKMTADLPAVEEQWGGVSIIYIGSATGSNNADYGIFTDGTYAEQLDEDACQKLFKKLKTSATIIGRIVRNNRGYTDYRCYWMNDNSGFLFLTEMSNSNSSVEFKTVGFIEGQIPSE